MFLMKVFFKYIKTLCCSISVESAGAAVQVCVSVLFDVPVTVHCVKFLIIKPTKRTNFSNLFLE